MGRSGRRSAVLLICLVATLSLALAGNQAGAKTPARTTWQLVDYHQTGCFSSNVHTHWYAIYIDGRWKSPLDVGIVGLPAGGTFTTSYAPIPPGSSSGEYSLAYVGVQLPPDTPLGTYTADLWAGNARSTDSVPVTLVVQSRCGY